MKLPDAIKWCAHNLYIACDTELFDKRIKPWKLQVLFLNEKIKIKQKQIQELCGELDLQTDHQLPDSIIQGSK